MSILKHTYHSICLAMALGCLAPACAQTADSLSIDTAATALAASAGPISEALLPAADSIAARVDSMVAQFDSLKVPAPFAADSLRMPEVKTKERFVPDPKKAMWLAMVIPGGGQIYNRKYWKLPLIYGGFIGCVYAMTWNNTMYRDYSQAYIDIMDTDDNTKSYENFLPPNYDVNANMDRLKDLFKRKKNYYRRYRDLSMFCMIGVYALSILDAYIDAEMSSFDISDELTMKVKPTIINERHSVLQAQGMHSSSYGLQCSFSF